MNVSTMYPYDVIMQHVPLDNDFRLKSTTLSRGTRYNFHGNVATGSLVERELDSELGEARVGWKNRSAVKLTTWVKVEAIANKESRRLKHMRIFKGTSTIKRYKIHWDNKSSSTLSSIPHFPYVPSPSVSSSEKEESVCGSVWEEIFVIKERWARFKYKGE